jgi:hypothetical protein
MKDHPAPNDPPPFRGRIVGGGAIGVLAIAHLLRGDPLVRATLLGPRERVRSGRSLLDEHA